MPRKRKHLDYPSYRLRQPVTDLFGDVVVTEDDLYEWVSHVSPVHCTARLYDNYVRRYDVASKVRTAKLRGIFEDITSRPVVEYHARLDLARIV